MMKQNDKEFKSQEMTMKLHQQARQILEDLKQLLHEIEPDQFHLSLQVLHGNSVGKHSRHILEFFMALENEAQEINYDARKRDLVLETDRASALEKIEWLQEQLVNWEDRSLSLVFDYGAGPQSIQSSLFRELLYNIEHATHHLALLKVGLEQEFKWMHLPENLGLAYSTQLYQKA